ncbi:MAG TPA: HAD-IIA family hydrolase [Firmicutes bacterium]|nr:HAD-IIA family hydrolase [Bacillota bacterium]
MPLYDGYIFDLDGTIYLGENLIPGADRVVAELRAAGKGVVFLSNKPIQTRYDYAAKLTRLGIPTDVGRVINSSFVLAQYLRREAPGCLCYVIGEQALLDDLDEAGVKYILEPEKVDYRVDYVVLAFDRTFDYQKLNRALQCVKRGARLIATNGDRTCPVEGGEIPDAGGVIGAVEGTSGKKVELIVGKPNPMTLKVALDLLGLPPERCLMVGDRIETDILMGKKTGLATALVMTGVTSWETLEASEVEPDYVLNSVVELRTR